MQKLLSLKKTIGLFIEQDDGAPTEFVEKAVSDGSKQIYAINEAGLEDVTNIEKSVENEFIQTYSETRKRNKKLKQELKQEEEQMKMKFEEIVNKWSLTQTGPIDLFEEIVGQKQRCSEVLNSKNKIILTLEEEQRIADEAYKDLIIDFNKVGFFL